MPKSAEESKAMSEASVEAEAEFARVGYRKIYIRAVGTNAFGRYLEVKKANCFEVLSYLAIDNCIKKM